MSLTSQLHELIKFLAPLVAEDDEGTPDPPITDEATWQEIAEDLGRAATSLERAGDDLSAAQAAADSDCEEGQRGEQGLRLETGAESARDRAQWIREMHDRALVNARRSEDPLRGLQGVPGARLGGRARSCQATCPSGLRGSGAGDRGLRGRLTATPHLAASAALPCTP